MGKIIKRGKEGNAASYTTRNRALNRLQIKLPEFRRLCILKGIHPREPKKKVHGHNKTYYHVKDINFLAHERLIETGRELKVYENKVKKAKGRLDTALLERLKSRKPEYTLDHLVKERYPSFLDAIRDLDDPLTLVHLFATLPADSSHKIPVSRIQQARRLSLEWQAYITRTHTLRKIFVSVKGTYFQAEVMGQKVTWLVPHALSQQIPDEVDFRVMLTFLEFYETLLSFANFKLYHDLGLAYPPVLDPKLEEAAADLYAIMKDLSLKLRAGKAATIAEGSQEGAEGENPAEKHAEAIDADTALRLASLQSRLAAMKSENGSAEGSAAAETEEAMAEIEDEESLKCRSLFKDFVFYLSREVPRESLLFVIRSFGGTATWDGDGAPLLENDESITHQIVDRPSQQRRILSREYVQPQWIVDCANCRLILPTEEYGPGLVPPPHLSPFVDHDAEGYTPEYAETLQRLKQSSEGAGVAALPGAEVEAEELDPRVEAALRVEDLAASKHIAEIEAQEKQYVSGIVKELEGIAYSASVVGHQKVGEVAEEEEQQEEETVAASVVDEATEKDDEKAMAQMMMPRKTKKLYEAMQMGKAKASANVQLLRERKRKAALSRAGEKKGTRVKKQ